MTDQKKFLDAEGVKYLWSKINMQDYPNNETLMDVIEAIDETKADKSEIVQSDWDQNDENATDYIKNRPFYDYEDYGEWLSFNVSTMEKSEYGDYYSMYVGRANPIGDFIFSLNVGDVIQVNWDGVIYNCRVTLDDSAGCSFRQFGNLSIGNTAEENTGEPFKILYGYNAWSTPEGYVHSYADMSNTTFLCRTYTINTRQLDEKHIPNTIARVKDIPEQVQSDWNQDDETAADYVKNRTHYEGVAEDEVTITIKPNDVVGASVADRIYEQRETAKYSWNGAFKDALQYWFDTSDGTGDYLLYDGVTPVRATKRFENTLQFYTISNDIFTDLDGERITIDVTYTGEVKKVHKLDIKYLPVTTDEEIIDLLMQLDMLPALTDSDGSMLSDENGDILSW